MQVERISVKMAGAVAPVVLVHGGAGSIPESMNEDKFKGTVFQIFVY
jgi:hypothetical protein